MNKNWIYLIIITKLVSCVSPTLHPCPLQAPEQSQNFVLECRGLNPSHQVTWQRDMDGTPTDLGSCDPHPTGPCLSSLPQLVQVTRPESNLSRLTLLTVERELYGGATFRCTAFSGLATAGVWSCPMDVIYQADVGSCRVEPVVNGTAWFVRVSCYIDKVFSSRQLYSCQLFQAGEDAVITSSTYSPELSSVGGTVYGDGECVLTTPVRPHPVNYTVKVFPGPTVKAAGSFTPVLPASPPSLRCQPNRGLYVLENKFIDCTCTASDLGYPAGRLLIYREDEVLLVTGDPGDSEVTMPGQKLSRADNGTLFRCVLLCDWAGAVQPRLQANISVGVAYGPEEVQLTDPGTFDIHPAGNATLTLTCNVTSVGPSVTLTWEGACEGHVGSTCTFTPALSDERSTVTCTAHNRFNNVTKVASRPLLLNYPPQEAPVITGVNGTALQPGQSLLVSCHVLGGQPPLSAVTLTCKGQAREAAGQSVSMNVTVEADDHGDKCTCSGRWKDTDWYTLHTDVFFIVLQPPEILSLTVNGSGGLVSLQQSTTDILLLTCLSRGVPSPTLTLSKAGGREVARRSGGQVVPDRRTWLTVVLPALCASTGLYRCDLGQGAGPGDNVTSAQQNTSDLKSTAALTLDVRCLPQIDQAEPAPLHPLTTPNLTFQLESNPAPTLFSFSYLGAQAAPHPRQHPLGPTAFKVSCSPASLTSLHTCVISVVTASEVTQGLYVLVVQNDLGEGRFRFNVVLDGEWDQRDVHRGLQAARRL